MTKDALDAALTYIEDHNAPAQITYDGKGNYTVDFQSRVHAEVCCMEVRERGFYNTQTLLTGHHMRVE